MNKKTHSIVAVVASAALLAGCSQPKEAVLQNMNSQKGGNEKSTSEVQDITPSGISTTGQPEKGVVVYMATDVNSGNLMEVYQTLGAAPTGRVTVKLSTEGPGSNYPRTGLIGGPVQSLQTAIVECNTVYGGVGSNTAMHYQVTEDHDYTAIANIDIMDEGGSMTLPVTGGTNLTKNYVGEHLSDYDYYVILFHFRGHVMAGSGGTIKSISTGPTSVEGENHIYTAGRGGSMQNASQDPLLGSTAEAGKSVTGALNRNILYISVINRLSVNCDCDTSPAESDIHDMGILASYDPVALDQACVDLVYAAADGQSLVNRIGSRNGIHTLEQAEKIGLGSRACTLVNLDEQKIKVAAKIIFRILELRQSYN